MEGATLVVITARARATIHIPSIEAPHETFDISKTTIKQTLKNIHIIVIHHAMSILLDRSTLENNQPLSELFDPP